MRRIVAIATYRGCFDGFSSVVDLTDDYLGCRSQTWNNKRRQWCLCNTDLCNVHFDLQSPLPPSQHQRHPSPPVAHGNGAPPPSFSHQIPSKHPVRPSQDKRNEFFESFADKAKYRQSPISAPSDSLVFPEDYVEQPRPNEASAGRNLTNYNEAIPLDHFKEQDDHDVLIEEPIAFDHVQDKRHDDMKSQRSLPLPGQRKKVTQKKLEDNDRPSKVIKQITYDDADIMSFESLDYPYNQDERYRTISVSPQVSELEALDDLDLGRKSDSVQADGPDNLLQNSDSTTIKLAYGITGTDKGKELKTVEAQRGLEKNPKDEKLYSVFTEDAVDPDLSEDYPYNQLFNQELAKEDLELLTKPRPFELRFSQTLDPPSESAQKQESAKSALEVHNDNSKEQGRESTRPKEGEVRAKEFNRKEFLSTNDLVRPGSINDKERNRPEANPGKEIGGFDARARLAIRDADILWIGQDRAPDDADPSYFTVSENSEHKKTTLERGPVGSKLEKETQYRHYVEQEKKNDEEEEETRSGKEADLKEEQSLDQDGQEAKNLKRTGVARRTEVREQQNEEEEFSAQRNQVEQTTLKTGMSYSLSNRTFIMIIVVVFTCETSHPRNRRI